jgi:hypothetical protein
MRISNILVLLGGIFLLGVGIWTFENKTFTDDLLRYVDWPTQVWELTYSGMLVSLPSYACMWFDIIRSVSRHTQACEQTYSGMWVDLLKYVSWHAHLCELSCLGMWAGLLSMHVVSFMLAGLYSPYCTRADLQIHSGMWLDIHGYNNDELTYESWPLYIYCTVAEQVYSITTAGLQIHSGMNTQVYAIYLLRYTVCYLLTQVYSMLFTYPGIQYAIDLLRYLTWTIQVCELTYSGCSGWSTHSWADFLTEKVCSDTRAVVRITQAWVLAYSRAWS